MTERNFNFTAAIGIDSHSPSVHLRCRICGNWLYGDIAYNFTAEGGHEACAKDGILQVIVTVSHLQNPAKEVTP